MPRAGKWDVGRGRIVQWVPQKGVSGWPEQSYFILDIGLLAKVSFEERVPS